jgi:small neutral amino acid transporter SnatA (MarC family)
VEPSFESFLPLFAATDLPGILPILPAATGGFPVRQRLRPSPPAAGGPA